MPCEGCPASEAWADADEAMVSDDTVISNAGQLAKSLLEREEPTQPIVLESGADGQAIVVCCQLGRLQLARTTLRRTRLAVDSEPRVADGNL